MLSANATNDAKKSSKILNSAKILSLAMALSVFGGLQYFLVFRHMERVPQTGRWRKMNVTRQIETQLGEEAYFSIVSRYRHATLPEDHPITRYVREIVSAILDVNDLGVVVSAKDPVANTEEVKNEKDRRWRLAVIADDNVPNSTASTGGIIVFTGLLSLCEDEHELAAILGHEIAHVVVRHLAERYSRAKEWSLKQLLLGQSVQSPKSRRQAEEEYKQMMSSNLHEQELEADAIGLQLSARACFEPRAAIDVNRRLAAMEERLRRMRPEFKPTHPCSEERIKRLERLLPKAYEMISKSPRCTSARAHT